jgi:hypothetical protein
MSLLFGFVVFFFTYPFIQFWAILLAISVFVISVVTLHKKQESEPKKSGLYVIGVVREIQYEKSDQKTGREIKRFDLYSRKLDFKDDILALKGHNKNIAIIGMAGSGKTELTYFIIDQMTQYHKIIFQYKNSDRYRELGYPVLFLKKYSPDVFRNKEAFTQAWITAFTVENRGITASQIEPIIRDIVGKVKNWKEFKAEAEERFNKEQGTITGNAIADILLKLQSVYSENQYDFEIPDDLVVDFESLNEQSFVFFAEYLLRELYEQIKSGERKDTMIFIDEAHKFTKTKNTIIPELAAIIRSRGAFLFSTQRVSTIAGDVKGNAGLQFSFKQTEKDDLDQIKSLSEPYHWITQRLKPYEFCDLAQNDSHEGIYIYRLYNPKPQFKPVVEWQPESTEKVNNSKGEGGSQIDIPKEIIRLLSQPANQQDLAKRFSKDYGKDANFWKMTLKGYLKTMQINNEISADITDYVKFSTDGKVYEIRNSIIYHRKGTYDYHDFLVNVVADILYRKGFIPLIQAHGLPLADILVEPKKLAFEIETGSKNGYKIEETKQRVEDFKKREYKVYVIVPNQEVKKKYVEAGFSNVFTALELWEEKL